MIHCPLHGVGHGRYDLVTTGFFAGLSVSEADWKPGTAKTPVSLSYGVDEAESYDFAYKEGGFS